MISIDFEHACNESEDDDVSHFFVDHLRKCFIASDSECFCEHLIVPELETQIKTDVEVKRGLSEPVDDRKELWRIRLSNYLNTKNYDYLRNLGGFC
jgi:hypothetical protein